MRPITRLLLCRSIPAITFFTVASFRFLVVVALTNEQQRLTARRPPQATPLMFISPKYVMVNSGYAVTRMRLTDHTIIYSDDDSGRGKPGRMNRASLAAAKLHKRTRCPP